VTYVETSLLGGIIVVDGEVQLSLARVVVVGAVAAVGLRAGDSY
jgi:glutamate synthase domain-containing protein 3